MKALIFFGHGARDSRWREPFDRLAQLWGVQHSEILVQTAFLEFMDPSLEGAVASLVSAGATDVVIVPVFFGQGGHFRSDFPKLIAVCKKQFPTIQIASTPVVGEDEAILQSIINFGARYS